MAEWSGDRPWTARTPIFRSRTASDRSPGGLHAVALETGNAARGPDGEGAERTGPMIKVKVNGAELELPVMIAFGQAENTIVIPLGYGQGFDGEDKFGRNAKGNAPAGHVGQVGVNSGFNAYPLRTAETAYYAAGATVEKTGKRYPLALVQEHFAMYGRGLAREISTIDSGDHKGGFEEQLHNVKLQGNDGHAPPNISLYKQQGKDGKAGKQGKPGADGPGQGDSNARPGTRPPPSPTATSPPA